ncbi:MAG: RNA polymerase sigma factor [Spirochaetales bacterium]
MQESGEAESEQAERVEASFREHRPSLIARLRAGGRTLEEAEDLVQEVYAETLAQLPVVSTIRSLPAWINSLARRRSIDLWRRKQTAAAAGHVQVAEETIREIVTGVGLDPLNEYVRDTLTGALNDAIRVLPREQRDVVGAQVFGGQTFREIAERTGVSIDTLTARKRYAIKNLTRALRNWIET